MTLRDILPYHPVEEIVKYEFDKDGSLTYWMHCEWV